MTETTQPQPRLRPFADSSPAAVVAGFVAMLTGYTSSLVLMFQAGQNAGLSSAQISSWIWALSIGMGLATIGLTLRYRVPIVIAWSTPGAALLISSLPGVPYSEAIGAFIVCALLITLCGVTGSFERLMRQVPSSLASALLAGVLFRIGIEICNAAEQQTLLVLAMFFSYLLCKRFSPRYAVFAALLVGSCWPGYWANWTSAGSAWNWRYRSGPRRASPWPPPSASASRCSSSPWRRRTCPASPCCAPTATRCRPRR